MSIKINSLKNHYPVMVNHLFPTEIVSEAQNTILDTCSCVPTENLPLPDQNENLSLSLEPMQAFLEEEQKNTLSAVLATTYLIPGINGAPYIELQLFPFLRELQMRLLKDLPSGEHVTLALIGSAVGHILNSQQVVYNDLDFLIQIQIPVEAKQLAHKTFIERYIKQQVKDHCNKTRYAIEACLATLFNAPENDLNILTTIGGVYFNNQSFHNGPINWDDLLHPLENRCSIIGFGDLEFKTTIDICIQEAQTAKGVIPGLKDASAFNRDDIRIYFPPDYFNAENNGSTIPIDVRSCDVPFSEAIEGLKTRELRTLRIDGSKCIKGIENMTFKGCFYPENETNRAIFIQFLKMPDAFERLEKLMKKHSPHAAFCALSNFYINSANLGMDLIQPLGCILEGLSPQIPGELLLKWSSLRLFLSARPASHTSHVLALNGYYLLKPKRPVDLLLDFMQMQRKHPGISLETLPFLGLESKTKQQLFSEMKPYLEGEQLILFNHELLSHFPDLLDQEKDLEFEMLKLLSVALPNLNSTGMRQERVRQTKRFFDRKNLEANQLFKHLDAYAQAGGVRLSQIFLTCIQDLAPSNPKMALELWYYADQEMVFADSGCEELEAFACIQRMEPTVKLNKKQLMAHLENMMFRLSYVSKKLTSEPNSFNALLLPLVSDFAQGDFNFKELKFIQTLLNDIAPLSSDIKDEIAGKFLDAFIRSASKKRGENELNLLLGILKGMLKTCSEKAAEKHMNKMLLGYVQCCLRSQESMLIQAAENILRSGIKSPFPSVNARLAGLFSDLICIHAKTDRAEALLTEALEQKILGKETPTELLKASFAALQGKTDNRSRFVETMLQNPSFVHALQDPQIPDAHERILLLINHSYQVESIVAIENLARLLNPLYKYISLNALQEAKSAKLEMLKHVLRALPNFSSVPMRQALIQQTQRIFEEKGLKLTSFFEHLNFLSTNDLSLIQIFQSSIQDLAPIAPKLAHGLWHQAEKEAVFADSAVDELNVFTRIQEMNLAGQLSKKQLIANLKGMTDRLSHLHPKLTLKNTGQLDPFNSLLLSLVFKVCEGNRDFETLKSIQRMLVGITPLICISESLKDEMIETFFDAFIRLELKGMKNEELLEIYKWMLGACSEKTAGTIVHHLKNCPNGLNLSGRLIKTVHFKSALIDEMKQGTLKDNIGWFTLLYKGNLLHPNDQKSWECCGRILSAWKLEPDSRLLNQVLPAFQFLKNSLEKNAEKEINAVLKTQALNGYTDFVQGCLSGQVPQLIQEAENVLREGIKFICPLENAGLFADLICNGANSKRAEELLTRALKQKVFSEKTPAALIRAYLAALDGAPNSSIKETKKAENPKKSSPFVDDALQNPTLIHLAQDPETENANKLILSLMNNSGRLKSHIAIKNLVDLFKQLYENRKTSNDASLDWEIYESTYLLFDNLSELNDIDFRVWIALFDVLKADEIIHKQHKVEVAHLCNLALRMAIEQLEPFMDKNCSIEEQRKTCLKLLKVFEKYETVPLLMGDFVYLQGRHLAFLLKLNLTQELLEKLKSMNIERRFEALQQALIIFLRNEKEKFHATPEQMEQLLALLDEYRQPHPMAGIFKFNTLELWVYALLEEDYKREIAHVPTTFAVLQKLLISHPEKFEHLEETCIILLDTACKLGYILHASSILQLSEEKKFITDQKFLDQVRSEIKRVSWPDCCTI